jgi:hypothetical protein
MSKWTFRFDVNMQDYAANTVDDAYRKLSTALVEAGYSEVALLGHSIRISVSTATTVDAADDPADDAESKLLDLLGEAGFSETEIIESDLTHIDGQDVNDIAAEAWTDLRR